MHDLKAKMVITNVSTVTLDVSGYTYIHPCSKAYWALLWDTVYSWL